MSLLIRQIHRWISIAFTLGFLVNLAAWLTAKPPVWLGLFVLVPLIFLLATGLYLFALPYLAKACGGRAKDQLKTA